MYGRRIPFFAEEKKNSKEIEESIWRKKIFLCEGDEERRMKISWRGKNYCGQDRTDIKGSIRGSCGPKKVKISIV